MSWFVWESIVKCTIGRVSWHVKNGSAKISPRFKNKGHWRPKHTWIRKVKQRKQAQSSSWLPAALWCMLLPLVSLYGLPAAGLSIAAPLWLVLLKSHYLLYIHKTYDPSKCTKVSHNRATLLAQVYSLYTILYFNSFKFVFFSFKHNNIITLLLSFITYTCIFGSYTCHNTNLHLNLILWSLSEVLPPFSRQNEHLYVDLATQ